MIEKQNTTEPTEQWYGGKAETTSNPLVNHGKGAPVVMRFFNFEANPEVFKRYKPTKQELFNAHAQQIRIMLWSDGLEPYDAIEPKVIISKDKKGYRIMVTCIPKKGVAVTDTTQTLQELIKSNGRY